MFQNQPNKYFRIISNNARNIKYGRGNASKNALNIFIAWVVLPMLFQFISDAFRFRKEKQLQAALLGPINNLLILGNLAKTMVGWALGDTFDFQPTPVVSPANKLKAAIQKLGKDEIEMEDIVEAIEYIAEASGNVAGLPTPYAVQAERAIRKGKPAELVFSEYSLGEDEGEATPDNWYK